MENISTDWTKIEFKAYLLLYCALSNHFESEDEKQTILALVPSTTYAKIHKEIERDNDYQSIQKILFNLDKFNYDKGDVQLLLKDVQKVFLADGEVDLLETNMFYALTRLLQVHERSE